MELIADADWGSFLKQAAAAPGEAGGGVQLDPARMEILVQVLDDIMNRTHAVHDVITDGFINHQILLD